MVLGNAPVSARAHSPHITPEALAEALGVHPLVAAILIARGYDTPARARAFLDPDHYPPTSPFALPDMERAVAVLREAIAQKAPICVWGDFDVDGQTATSVLLLSLRALGAEAFFYIPSRQEHGHGLHEAGLRAVHAQGARVVLTCDCGVSDFEAVQFANQLGLRVVITDHHDPVREGDALRLPEAEAVVNPKRLEADHPLVHLPGVGVAYKLAEALLGAEDAAPLLDLVALGIVADVAWQQGETRYLLQRGLAQLRRSQRVGLQALARSAGVALSSANEDTIGFQLGPRLNAAGRLSTADRAVVLLTTRDEVEAEAIASELEQLNLQRRQLQSAIEQEALAMMQRDPALAQAPVVVLDAPHWHVGLIGTAASALVARLGKPVILISAPPGQVARASARSIEGVDIHAAIAAQAHLLEECGGHPMAAGFTIRSERIPAFREAVAAHVAEQLRARPSAAQETFPVAWRDVGLALAEQLEQLAPFGAGNPRPLLRTEGLQMVRAEPLGAEGRHRALFLRDAAGAINRALWWRSADAPLPDPKDAITLVFTLRREVFNARAQAQIVVHALIFDGQQSLGEPAPALNAQFLISDLRKVPDRYAALRRLLEAHGAHAVQVCSVAERPADLPPALAWRTRAQLQPCALLVVWDAPPGPREFAAMVRRAEPQHVVLLCAEDNVDEPQSVIAHVLGMIKVATRRGDALDDPEVIARMAARINQREDTVRAVIRWHQGEARQREVLRYLLAETRAYRRYVCEAPAEEVLRLP